MVFHQKIFHKALSSIKISLKWFTCYSLIIIKIRIRYFNVNAEGWGETYSEVYFVWRWSITELQLWPKKFLSKCEVREVVGSPKLFTIIHRVAFEHVYEYCWVCLGNIFVTFVYIRIVSVNLSEPAPGKYFEYSFQQKDCKSLVFRNILYISLFWYNA